MSHPLSRNTLYVEQAELLAQDAYADGQFHMKLLAPETAMHAKPGHFIHMQCDPALMMRRPMSIMRSNSKSKSIEVLYKVHGEGTALLASRQPGNAIDLIGPIGRSFKLDSYKKRPLLIGGGVGIPPMVFLAEHMKNTNKKLSPLVIMGSEVPFPFKTRPSQIILQEMPTEVIATMSLLEDWGIPARLTSLQNYPGCYQGVVTDLARHWLDNLDADERSQVEIFSCGPTPMLKAVAQLADEYGLSCQISLEEYMACAVGGCAGCTVLIETEKGPAMQRVCVDGPVFEAKSVIQFQA